MTTKINNLVKKREQMTETLWKSKRDKLISNKRYQSYQELIQIYVPEKFSEFLSVAEGFEIGFSDEKEPYNFDQYLGKPNK